MKAFAIAFLAAGMLVPHAAGAMSAYAAGVPDDIAASGVAFGMSYNYGTRDEAIAAALQGCRARTDAPAAVALCQLVAYFDNECLAVAMDPQTGTPGYGWSVGTTLDTAKAQALTNCRATAGAGRVSYCVVTNSACDTTALGSK